MTIAMNQITVFTQQLTTLEAQPLLWLGFSMVTFGIGGMVVDRLVIRPLGSVVAKHEWAVSQCFIDSLKTWPILWGAFLGAYLTMTELPLTKDTIRHIENVWLIGLTFSLILYASHLMAKLVTMFLSSLNTNVFSTSLLIYVVRASIFSIGLLIILQILGVSVLPILTALGIGGLALSLALQDTLSNMFAGIQMILARQIQPGHFIRLSSGEEGAVLDINWRNTTLKQSTNNVFIIPNSKLASSIITNFDADDPNLVFSLMFSVDWNTSIESLESMCMAIGTDLMKHHPSGVPEYAPIVRFQSTLENPLQVIIYLQSRCFQDQFALRHEAFKRLHRAFIDNHIVINQASAPVTKPPNAPASTSG